MPSPITYPGPLEPVVSVVNGPDGGDARTADSVRVPMASIMGMVQWLYGVLQGTVGGAFHFAGTLSVAGPLTLNSLIVNSDAVINTLRYRLKIVDAPVTAGTHLFDPTLVQHVFTSLVPPAGVIWQIDESVNTALDSEVMRFVNTQGPNAIAIKDPAGATLFSISYVEGFTYAVTVAKLSGVWTVIDRSVR